MKTYIKLIKDSWSLQTKQQKIYTISMLVATIVIADVIALVLAILF